HEDGWKHKGEKMDFYLLKGIAAQLLQITGVQVKDFVTLQHSKFEAGLEAMIDGKNVLLLGVVHRNLLNRFEIKQPVFFADFNWQLLSDKINSKGVSFSEIPKFPAVHRDLAIIVSNTLQYETVEKTVQKIKLDKLRDIRLFDIFESEKLGAGKKSLAVSFTFSDEEKTLTDKEIDGWMNKIITTFEKDLQAEIRK
ncbi:MAG: phenylalanine--tRNA ligase subunit beta, partial [Chitinophagaceae bacterium]|nr:phenylalanine--tRNA ligase subunit beta [Chitinophagaceae bacterium]